MPPSPHAIAAAAPPPAKPVRVTHLSTTDVIGGAARAMQRLHRGLAAAGVQSRQFVAQRFGSDAAVSEYNVLAPAPRALGQLFFRATRRRHHPPVRVGGSYLSPGETSTGWRLAEQLPASDLLHLHWVTDFLDFRALPALARRHPLVWTFHDMNPFTGGCHYGGSCDRFVAACGACPQLARAAGPSDITRRTMDRKENILRQIDPSRLFVVTPSRWLAREAERGALFRRFPIRVIPNGLDLGEFRPTDRGEARRRLDLPPDARIVLFVAELISDPRKGFDLLRRALAEVGDLPNLLVVTLGSHPATLPASLPVRHLGSLPDADSLRLAYGAADVFAIPSQQDNLPNTLLEAMACGTPAVGFAVGGIGEAIVEHETGLLAPQGDAVGFGRAVRRILVEPGFRDVLAAGARRRAESEFSVGLQAERHAALYGEILEANAAMAPGARARASNGW